MARRETRLSRNERRRQRRHKASSRRRGDARPCIMAESVQPEPVAAPDPAGASAASDAPASSAPKPGERPFYLSSRWHWPVFEPECCQECGRVIPMHETGWILDELILCEECFIILDERLAERQNMVLASAPPATAFEDEHGVEPSEIATPAAEAAPAFELTAPPSFVPRVNFAGIAPRTPSEPHVALAFDSGATLFDFIETTPAEAPEELFEPIWLTDSEPSRHAERSEPSRPRARLADAASDTDALEESTCSEWCGFQLTSAPFAPRPCFASIAPPDEAIDRWRSSSDTSLFDAMDRDAASAADSFELTSVPFAPRLRFATIDLEAATVHALAPPRDDTLFDAIESTTSLPLAGPAEAAVETHHETAVLFTLTAALAPIEQDSPAAPAEAPAATEEQSPVLAAIAPAAPIAPSPEPALTEPSAATEPPPAPLRMPALDFKARRRAEPPPRRPAPSPLTFHHPVDILLNDLHSQHVDAQVWATLKRWRQMDPFHGEIEAMLGVAGELRDRWMSRREADGQRRSTAG